MLTTLSRLSSPAQAPSTTGSSRIATHFADILKSRSSQVVCGCRILDGLPPEGNSHLGYRRHAGTGKTAAPARDHWGSNGADRACIRREWRGNVDRNTPADQFQPRLLAWPTCLIATLEKWCVLSAPICRWKR